MQLNGSQIVMECLLEQGVDTVFGYPGGAILNVYDELYKYSDRIHHVLTSHEQGAAHAADGYARATGRVGVCFATSGPGATNLVTGIATAYMDSVPLVAITCNVGNAVLGKDSFQEIDISGITIPITKYSSLVKRVEDLAPMLRKAFRLAQEGRPGPVLVDITKDVTAAVGEYEPQKPEKIVKMVPQDAEAVETVLSMIREAKKPFVFAGGGVILADASEELSEFVKKLDTPVTLSLMGQGAFDEADPRYTGMLGMHGTKATNYGVAECDLLVGIGVRFSDRCTGNTKKFASHAKIVQIDIDPAEVNKNIRTDAHIIGDIRETLRVLNEKLEQQAHPEWMAHIAELKEKYPLTVSETGLSGPGVVQTVDRLTGADTVIVTDVGQHQMWASQHYTYRTPRTFLSSGGLGTMGYGLGAAIGAKVGCPDKTVVLITGDGCLRMNMNELATVSRNEIPVIVVVVNNHVLGMVRQWQTLFYGGRYSHTVLRDKVSFPAVAEAMGVKGYQACTKEELEAALSEALASGKAALIDCAIDSDEKVFPMVEPGGLLEDTFDENDVVTGA